MNDQDIWEKSILLAFIGINQAGMWGKNELDVSHVP
jgi:hypothetical protein